MEPYASTRIAQAPSPGSLQADTLQMFTVLCAMRHSFRQTFTLCLGEDAFASAVSLALLGLGGTCLVLDSDAGRLQAAGRSGSVDFTVTSLTEALRILKNEIRKGTAVSVGLAGVPKASIQEMLHRGVQPDLVCISDVTGKLLEPFISGGSLTVSLPPVSPAFAANWCLCCDEALNVAERRDNDARMLDEVPSTLQHGTEPDRIHQLWLTAAPRLFPRERNRIYWSAE